MESSDCQVTVEPGNGTIDFSLDSAVAHQFGNQIRKVTFETLKNLGVDNVKISIVDKGALDCTIKARIEGASKVLYSVPSISIRIFRGEVQSDD